MTSLRKNRGVASAKPTGWDKVEALLLDVRLELAGIYYRREEMDRRWYRINEVNEELLAKVRGLKG